MIGHCSFPASTCHDGYLVDDVELVVLCKLNETFIESQARFDGHFLLAAEILLMVEEVLVFFGLFLARLDNAIDPAALEVVIIEITFRVH